MALTPELVALAHRVVAHPGPNPDIVCRTGEDYDEWVRVMLASLPYSQDVWLFAYRSLIWKPKVVHIEAHKGSAHGWRRSFCFRIARHVRSTGLDDGARSGRSLRGRCIPACRRKNLEEQLGKLFRREFTAKPPNSMPRWIKVETGRGPLRAITFAMNCNSPAYVGQLAAEAVADILARACGHWGSGAEYLHKTVAHLEELGIHDRGLWRLQQLVAERISARAARPDAD